LTARCPDLRRETKGQAAFLEVADYGTYYHNTFHFKANLFFGKWNIGIKTTQHKPNQLVTVTLSTNSFFNS